MVAEDVNGYFKRHHRNGVKTWFTLFLYHREGSIQNCIRSMVCNRKRADGRANQQHGYEGKRGVGGERVAHKVLETLLIVDRLAIYI